ncbi:organic solute transporter subunit alpha [Sapajus apella]|uniref:Organic solute transporter subunit alpha n=1 Tax=Sapajus apella TaxID=9515 RepID=A0A6J3GPQ5_SAPAP|nr:organic solute transporter subunit alpha [Sapajus apella]
MEPGRTQIQLDPRYTADLLEVLKTNYGIPAACFSHPPTAAQILRGEWGPSLEGTESKRHMTQRGARPAERSWGEAALSWSTCTEMNQCECPWPGRPDVPGGHAVVSASTWLLQQFQEPVQSAAEHQRQEIERECLPACLTGYLLACHQISEESTALWINTFLGVSTLLALWTLGILFRQAKLHLGEQNIGAKFALFQVLLILTALQPSIFSVLANGGQIACSPPFSSKIRSQVMNCHLLILETFLMTVLTRTYYRRKDRRAGYEAFPSPDLDLTLKA